MTNLRVGKDFSKGRNQINSHFKEYEQMKVQLQNESVMEEVVEKPTQTRSSKLTGESNHITQLPELKSANNKTEVGCEQTVQKISAPVGSNGRRGPKTKQSSAGEIGRPKAREPGGRRKPLNKKPPIDPVIEQWYTDPYNRYDTQGPVGIKSRKAVLTTALRNRGFRGPRVVNIVNWLVRCKGQHKPYEQMVRSKQPKLGDRTDGRFSKRKRKQSVLYSRNQLPRSGTITPLNMGKETDGEATVDAEISGFNSDTGSSAHAPSVNAQASAKLEIPTVTEADHSFTHGCDDDDRNEEEEEEEEDPELQALTAEDEAFLQELSSQLATTTASSIVRNPCVPGTQAYRDFDDDQLFAALKRTQKFWKIVYGDDLDNIPQDDNQDVGFTYFRDVNAVPRVDVQYRSQKSVSESELKRVVHQSWEVVTEDETFGLYVPPKHEKIKTKKVLKFVDSEEKVNVDGQA